MRRARSSRRLKQSCSTGRRCCPKHEKLAAMSSLLASMAHELNNPQSLLALAQVWDLPSASASLPTMGAVFQRDGHVVDTAANGLQALAKLQERSYDLLVCDLHMPELDGSGLYRALVQTHPHLLPRLIFLTGDTLTPEAQAFLAASGAPYLTKPCRAIELRQVVQYTLQKLSEADCSAISHS